MNELSRLTVRSKLGVEREGKTTGAEEVEPKVQSLVAVCLERSESGCVDDIFISSHPVSSDDCALVVSTKELVDYTGLNQPLKISQSPHSLGTSLKSEAPYISNPQ